MARTEGDTWDLASSVGATATGVAAARALASRGPNPLIDDPFAEPLVKAVGVEVFTKMLSGEIDFEQADPSLHPRQMAERIAVRTRYFDDFFTAATDAGIRQAVILASGLDARAYRLPWPAGTSGVRDRPATGHRVQDHDPGRSRRRPTADLRAVGIDLRNDWPAALRAKRIRPRTADGVDRRGTADLPAARGAGPAVRQHRRTQCAGSRLATEHVPDTDVFTDERAQARSERWRRLGLNVDMAELVYQGKRSHVIRVPGRHVAGTSPPMPCRNCTRPTVSRFPMTKLVKCSPTSSYISATLK